ncbi:glucans biosynthesis glucosyltransferase H [Verticillium alfalfae VaMs.102]|uniref:Glucans biosynthesis glucosyltransferase H n=1 Tax=Verticillium alfalfae (strain VaMs.102 / ATCC MYA-4576 / FGSC 10136) TaxID=526221 RepID=C9SD88_VERA1|nr:glucans biosynthesis glucosyltransferase H [Verticillium alfalfae VaMs.102]EEY17053.1 glucans biosynthesis glucosyltransferase H [Verticillium alfalfae VaMs.102]
MCQKPLYRRRMKNSGYKAGNIMDYIVNHGKGDDFFVTLDSDSVMGGDLLVRMVSSMEQYPRLGLLQSQFLTVPAVSAFARLMQFGRRHGLRFRHLGSSWWFGDCGLYWGHNAIIRIKAFHENCMLPVLPNKPPLGGHILSHDVMEAIFMRRAGYEVRMIPLDVHSYETSPPTFLDYLRREHRWCQGSMQYWFMLLDPGIKPVSRYHVYHVISSYIGPAFRLLLALASIAKGVSGGYNDAEFKYNPGPQLLILGISLIPKAVGSFETAGTSFKRCGGHLRWAVSVLLELVIMALIGPAIDLAIMVYLLSMLSGKSTTWDGQNRDRLGLSWRDSLRVLWPQTLLGFSIAGLLSIQDALPRLWFLPFVTSLCLAIPISVLTASPRLSQFTVHLRLFMASEEGSSSQAPMYLNHNKAFTTSFDRVCRGRKSSGDGTVTRYRREDHWTIRPIPEQYYEKRGTYQRRRSGAGDNERGSKLTGKQTTTCNKKTDAWGEGIEYCASFHVEVTKAFVTAVSVDRTAIHLSPPSDFGGMLMENPDLSFRRYPLGQF